MALALVTVNVLPEALLAQVPLWATWSLPCLPSMKYQHPAATQLGRLLPFTTSLCKAGSFGTASSVPGTVRVSSGSPALVKVTCSSSPAGAKNEV